MRAPLKIAQVIAIVCLAFGFGGQAIAAGKITVPKPEQASVCPVCGMFVAKYPEWVAVAVYKNGHAHFFDGAKDLMKYLIDPPRYAPGHRKEDIVTIAVTDYYNVEPIDVREAYFVIGSDVLGPMGHELVPLASQTEAEEFLKDHSGSAIIRFGAVTPELLDRLDKGGGQ
jgi:nitrous oxide reductase accessory protein NosL